MHVHIRAFDMPGFKKLRFINTFLFYRWRGSEYWTKDDQQTPRVSESAAAAATAASEHGPHFVPANTTEKIVYPTSDEVGEWHWNVDGS